MPMNTSYLDGIAAAGGGLVTHIGLVSDTGSPVGDRLPVAWAAPANGVVRPSADLTFDVPGGSTVAGWRGYDAATAGTDHGGAALPAESFSGDGTYTLQAASTGISHSAA